MPSDLGFARYARDATRSPTTAVRFLIDFLTRTEKLHSLVGAESTRYLNEVKPFYEKILTDLSRTRAPLSSTLRPWAIPLIYAIVRATKPRYVVETGVASGVSSAFILEALDRNGQGNLFSIDLPSDSLLPPGKSTGWIVPNQLRGRWHLLVGDSRTQLLPMLQELEWIDMFIHDSDHSYSTMYYEFQTSWDHLGLGGLLVCDDWWQTNAFRDFAKAVRHNWLHIARFGFIRKNHS